MIRVIMALPAGQEVKLIPEHTPVREVLNQFPSYCENKAYALNGVLLDEEDLEKNLVHFSKGDEVRINFVLNPAPKPADEPEAFPPTAYCLLSPAEVKAHMALLKAREALDEAIRSLGTLVEEDEPPF